MQQINYLKLKFQLEGIIEDGLDIVELGWEEVSDSKKLKVDCNQEEEDEINLRTRFILTHSDNWLRRQSMKVVHESPSEKFPKLVSFSKPLTSDI